MKKPSKVSLERRMARTHAVERNEARRLANVRLIRTVVLGIIATAAAFYWIGDGQKNRTFLKGSTAFYRLNP